MAATEVMPVKPPRPPNSWILYRAYMMKKLQPKDSRERRLSQSEMSSLIASMWRNATADTKREFEEMAERLKLEHQAKYPGYKYQPRKKEEKERAKELQKQQRQAQKRDMRSKRGVSASAPSIPPPPIHPLVNPYYYNPHMLSFAAALSPPLSAASSPLSGNDAVASPKPLLLTMTPPPVASQPLLPATELRLPAQLQVTAEPTSQGPLGTFLPPLVGPIDTTPQDYSATPLSTEPAPQNQNPVWQPSFPSEAGSSSNSLSFEVDNWILDPDLASFLSSSTPGLFQVQGLDQVELNTNPDCELELSIPDLNVSQEVTTFLKAAFEKTTPTASSFAGSLSTDVNSNDQYDLSTLLNPYHLESSDASLNGMGFFDSSYSMPGQSGLYSDQLYPVEQSHNRSTSDTVSHFSYVEPSVQSPEPSSNAASSSHPYVPPSGAILSSTRRVAGKWSLPPFISASSRG